MTIEKINAVLSAAQTSNYKKIKEYSSSQNAYKNDEINISEKAQEALELSKLVNKIAGQNSVGIREDKVIEAKEKLANGYYLNQQVTEKVAQKIAEFLI